MNYNFDLDIHNYKIDDLMTFLSLPKNYSVFDLNNNVKIKTVEITSLTDIDDEYKYNILTFINESKKLLSYKFINKDSNNSNNYANIKETIDSSQKTINNIGQILNPLSNKPSLQTASLPNNNISGYNVQVKTTSYMFNTKFRSNYFNTRPSDCQFNLPAKLNNVVSIKLSALQVPNVMLTFDALRGTSNVYIKEHITDTSYNAAFVQIPNGNYSIDDFPVVLQKAINNQVNPGVIPGRFTVTINKFNHFTTISNTTYNFTMNIINNPVEYITRNLSNVIPCTNSAYRSKIGYDNDLIDSDKDISPSMLYNTMGYCMGYRQPIYIGAKSYTSESMFDNVFTDYIYFVLNDYNKNYRDVVTGILPNELIAENILALIPITSNQFDVTFSSAADLIFKTRLYDSPVEISKISIKMLNQFGELLNLYYSDYAFCIEVKTLYNISGGDQFNVERNITLLG